MRTLMLLTVLLACSEDLSGAGYACLAAPDADLGFVWYDTTTEPGAVRGVEAGPSKVVVVIDECHSSSVKNEFADCTAEWDGASISVVSEAGWTPPRGGQNDDCNILAAECPGPELTEGAWTLTYSGRSVDFEVPSGAHPCTDR